MLPPRLQTVDLIGAISSSVICLALLLGGCTRSPERAATATAAATPQTVRYVNEAGGFSLTLPTSWEVQERAGTPLGTTVLLGEAPLDAGAPAGLIHYAPTTALDRDAGLKHLCQDCPEAPVWAETTFNSLPAWQATTASDGETSRTWTVVENGDVLVLFALNDAEVEGEAGDVAASLRFAPVVDRPARAAAMAEAMRQSIVHQNEVDDGQVSIKAVEAMTWSDACLGAPLADELCAQTETSGYRVEIAAPAGAYVFHFEPVTTQLRLAAAPPVQIGPPLMEWQSLGVPCETAVIGAAGVAFGACGSQVLLSGPITDAARIGLLQDRMGELAAFEGETPAGAVRFFGQGARSATPAEQRQLAELARHLQIDAAGGAQEAALTWQRDDPDGACVALTILATGETVDGPCGDPAAAQAATGQLALEDLVQLYAWLDLFAASAVETPVDGPDNAATIRLTLQGQGFQEPQAAEWEPLLAFAAAVFDQIAGERQPATAPDAASPGCPTAGPGTLLLTAPDLGVCLLYPDTYTARRPAADAVVLAAGEAQDAAAVQAEIVVAPADGAGLDEAAAALAADFGHATAPAPVTIGGRSGLRFDEAAADRLSRQILLLDDDRLYRLTFAATGESIAPNAPQLEALYSTVADSLTFIDD